MFDEARTGDTAGMDILESGNSNVEKRQLD